MCDEQGISRVHFIKVDAERSELAVLLGSQRIIQRDHPEIFVEVGAEEFAEAGGPVTQYLVQFGYLPGVRYGPNLLFVPSTTLD